MSSCQRSLGCSAAKRMMLERGRLCGCGVTNPRADRIRQIVDTAGRARALLQVRGDRGGAGLVPAAVEFLAQGEDLLLHLPCGAVRARPWTPRPRRQAGFAFGEEPLHQGDHPAAGEPVGSGDLGLRAALHQDRGHHQLRRRHRSPLDVRCERCPETAVNDVLNSDTVVPTAQAVDSVLVVRGRVQPDWMRNASVGAPTDLRVPATGSF
jgi:hypothetical protein